MFHILETKFYDIYMAVTYDKCALPAKWGRCAGEGKWAGEQADDRTGGKKVGFIPTYVFRVVKGTLLVTRLWYLNTYILFKR